MVHAYCPNLQPSNSSVHFSSYRSFYTAQHPLRWLLFTFKCPMDRFLSDLWRFVVKGTRDQPTATSVKTKYEWKHQTTFKLPQLPLFPISVLYLCSFLRQKTLIYLPLWTWFLMEIQNQASISQKLFGMTGRRFGGSLYAVRVYCLISVTYC